MLRTIEIPNKLKDTWPLNVWAGGEHTPESDPYRRGWTMKNIPSTSDRHEFVLLGRKGIAGCFLARLTSNGNVRVHMFWFDKPEDVAEVVKDDSILGPNPNGISYEQDIDVSAGPGWALPFIYRTEHDFDLKGGGE